MSKASDHMFLNVVDTRHGVERAFMRTILLKHGSFTPTTVNDGFIYSWNIGYLNSGAGIIVNPAYARKSEEEICLMCEIESPVTREDVQRYIVSYGHYATQLLRDTLWKIFEETNR